MNEKQAIYDELSRVLTDYENSDHDNAATEYELYEMLVKIQRQWETVITAQD